MKNEEIIKIGDDSIRTALNDTFAILDGDGNILTKIGDSGHEDEMEFSPNLDCSKRRSVILFDDEGSAKGAIDEILSPQENGIDYHVVKISCDDDDDTDFDIVADGLECEDENCDGEIDLEELIDEIDGEDDDYSDIESDLEGITLEQVEKEIEQAEEDEDDELVSMLNILKMIKTIEKNSENEEDDGGIDESFQETPSLKDIRRILKRNGYQLVSQRGGKQAWSKSNFDEPLYIPIDDNGESIDWEEIVRTRKLDVGV